MSELLGYFAAFLTTIAGVPQLCRIIKTKSVEDISLFYFVILTIGVSAWLVYGILLGLWPVIIANGVTFFITALILGYKIKYS